ncbi:hypothetical protein SmJEL517_g03832 [Synchytrium microbalum]|uniref:Carboxylic ester hydrolase n=1 Tax=Synchytrium microbalum TaxID=1806994 RepID=A0A507C5A8_9FUNG|nr:uncharacterized protein SmJEL517_g03832 [Synchytrium microbalum]TPX33166.1 hypothetical protein SmJEL517_g03832 [Synchytrium microbalum]
MGMALIRLLCILALIRHGLGSGSKHPATIVDTSTTATLSYGTFIGSSDSGLTQWLGIPYAAPPTGSNRFKPPQAPLPLSTPLQATATGSWCPQPSKQPVTNTATPAQSEDCLTLNIYAHINSTTERLPVMVWIHGGSSTTGSGSAPTYNGINLLNAVSERIVIVTINYRLGVLGWLAGSDMAAAGALNLGLLDQAYALQWVRTYIGAFGGNASHVTVAGESAGAVSIGQHLISYNGNQTGFDAAIMESGSTFSGTAKLPNATFDQTFFNTFLSNTACAGTTGSAAIIACLRGLTWQDIQASQAYASTVAGTASGVGNFHAVIDGSFLTASPNTLVGNGMVSKVPIIIGTNTDEGTIFTTVTTEAALSAFITSISLTLPAGSAATIASLYSSSTYGSPFKAASQMFADIAFICPARALSRTLSARGYNIWRYRFDAYLLSAQAYWNTLGVFHGSELPYVWNTGLQASESPLGVAIASRWTRFVTYFDPNGAASNLNGSAWPKYSGVTGPDQVFQSTTLPNFTTEPDTANDVNCDFWTSVGAISD